MKPNIVTSVVLLLIGFGAGEVMAQGVCDATKTYLTGPMLISTLQGKYVCAKRPGGVTADTWNEFHRGTGAGTFPIIDYKRGPGHPIDPSKVVGNYTVSTTVNTVTYDYGSGGTYTYVVRTIPASNSESAAYLFCNIATNEQIPAIISTSPIHALCTSP